MTENAFTIDGEVLLPQPDSHNWEPSQDGVLGYDGAGKPLFKKYRRCTLRSSHSLAFQAWTQYDDAATHTCVLPAPGAKPNIWTSYATCYVIVNEGEVASASAIGGIEMTILGAAAY